MTDYLTPKEVAAYAGVPVAAVFNWQDGAYKEQGGTYGPPFMGRGESAQYPVNAFFDWFINWEERVEPRGIELMVLYDPDAPNGIVRETWRG